MRTAVPSESRSGFTLVENLAALVVVATVALPLLGLLALSANGNRTAEFRQRAAWEVQQVMADLSGVGGKTSPWEALADRIRHGENRVCSQILYDECFRALREISPREFDAGMEGGIDGECSFVEVRLVRQEELSNEQGLEVSGPVPYYLASIRITAPAAAPLRNRHVECFSTRLLLSDLVNTVVP